MIAKNFLKFPSALIAQGELTLVFGVAECISEEAFVVIQSTFKASGEWLKKYAAITEQMAPPAPKWWLAMKARAKALAKAIKKAIAQLF